MALDRLDARIVAELQSEGRLTVVELGERIGLTGTPCARRVRQLEREGVIAGYAAIVDPVKLGLKVQAFVQVKLDRHTDRNVEAFERALASQDPARIREIGEELDSFLNPYFPPEE